MKNFIAVYGGSYNLPTETHRAIGVAVRDQIRPDKVWYLVSPQNPHKSTTEMAEFQHRVAMARLNVENEPNLIVSEIEKEIKEKTGLTHTAGVLRELMQRFPETRFAWVLGADCFANLHTWTDYEFILSHVPIVVVPRKGWTQQALESPAAYHIASHRIGHLQDLRSDTGWSILDFPEDEISATKGRHLIKQGMRPDSVRPSVYNYAKTHKLFL